METARCSGPAILTHAVRIASALLLLHACGCEQTQARPGDSAPAATADSTQAAEAPVDACALLTQAEVETATGRSVLAPQGEQVANLSTCAFGDPGAPVLDGRATSQTVSLSVFVGRAGDYYAGAVAQARDAYQMGRDNAASVEAVSGLGDDAYWDRILRTLNVLSGKYELEVEVASEAGGVEVARNLALRALPRLP